jgi:adenosylcobinamide-phosphate synthase
MEALLILATAVVIDLALGDPPDALHPVAWMGKVIGWLEKGGRRLPPAGQLSYGIIMTLLIAGLFTAAFYFLYLLVGYYSQAGAIILAGLLLKLTFSIRGLRRTAYKIRNFLKEKDLKTARHEIRALVSRETKNLSEPQLASAAVESVAEGLGDSLVAPLFYFLLFGLPGAIAYRAVNTLDSMIGYHGRYEHLGKFAARLDDILNFIPARLAALLLVLAAALKRNGRRAWQAVIAGRARTESPNAGWPMAAMAGALNTRLEKPGHYRLGDAGAAPAPETITRAVKSFLTAATLWLAICFIAEGVSFAITAQT